MKLARNGRNHLSPDPNFSLAPSTLLAGPSRKPAGSSQVVLPLATPATMEGVGLFGRLHVKADGAAVAVAGGFAIDGVVMPKLPVGLR